MVSVATTSGVLSVLAVSGFSFLEAIPFQFLGRINEAALPRKSTPKKTPDIPS